VYLEGVYNPYISSYFGSRCTFYRNWVVETKKDGFEIDKSMSIRRKVAGGEMLLG
jgi:hypothetical protein